MRPVWGPGYFIWDNGGEYGDSFLSLKGTGIIKATGWLKGPYGAAVALRNENPGLIVAHRHEWFEDDPVRIEVELTEVRVAWRDGGTPGWNVG